MLIEKARAFIGAATGVTLAVAFGVVPNELSTTIGENLAVVLILLFIIAAFYTVISKTLNSKIVAIPIEFAIEIMVGIVSVWIANTVSPNVGALNSLLLLCVIIYFILGLYQHSTS